MSVNVKGKLSSSGLQPLFSSSCQVYNLTYLCFTSNIKRFEYKDPQSPLQLPSSLSSLGYKPIFYLTSSSISYPLHLAIFSRSSCSQSLPLLPLLPQMVQSSILPLRDSNSYQSPLFSLLSLTSFLFPPMTHR